MTYFVTMKYNKSMSYFRKRRCYMRCRMQYIFQNQNHNSIV